MFDKFFNKKEKKTNISSNILVAALLIHAAKIDESYTDVEKKIIKEAIKELGASSQEEIEKIFINAEEKEKESNQIVEFTREIKKNPIEFRLKIIEILWKIVYSDGANDNYESNLIRRVCGLLYVSDKDNGTIKLKVKNLSNKL
ncbi:TerB family tellurite resistance protein [Pelagibacteraceae bacterium]|nr:TerB family tellurite resistance protein [Pelagibacteraceae bacterium]